MSEFERASALLASVPPYKLQLAIAYLQGLTADCAAVQEDIPNAETLAAFAELENGGGTVFTGSTADLFASLREEG